MKKINLSAIMIATIIGFSSAAFAGNINLNGLKPVTFSETAVKTSPISVKVIGTENNFLILAIQLKKTDEKAGLLKISDGVGEVLYTERIMDTTFNRIVKVSPEEVGQIELEYNTNDGISRIKYDLNVTNTVSGSISEVKIK
jgi:hypothetical protein